MRRTWSAVSARKRTTSRSSTVCRRRTKPLLVRYDLEALRRALPRQEIAARPAGLWRWHELLPVADPAHIVSLGEVETPLVTLSNSQRPDGFMPPNVQEE